MSEDIRKKILEHLQGLNELERQTDTDTMIKVIAERYDVPPGIVEQVIAEWAAGSKIKKDDEHQ